MRQRSSSWNCARRRHSRLCLLAGDCLGTVLASSNQALSFAAGSLGTSRGLGGSRDRILVIFSGLMVTIVLAAL